MKICFCAWGIVSRYHYWEKLSQSQILKCQDCTKSRKSWNLALFESNSCYRRENMYKIMCEKSPKEIFTEAFCLVPQFIVLKMCNPLTKDFVSHKELQYLQICKCNNDRVIQDQEWPDVETSARHKQEANTTKPKISRNLSLIKRPISIKGSKR